MCGNGRASRRLNVGYVSCASHAHAHPILRSNKQEHMMCSDSRHVRRCGGSLNKPAAPRERTHTRSTCTAHVWRLLARTRRPPTCRAAHIALDTIGWQQQWRRDSLSAFLMMALRSAMVMVLNKQMLTTTETRVRVGGCACQAVNNNRLRRAEPLPNRIARERHTRARFLTSMFLTGHVSNTYDVFS